jgi:hypothetical protein
MKVSARSFLVFTSSCFLLLQGCEKGEQFSPVPAITFKEFIHYTNASGSVDSLKAVISFTDGDGDIGLKDTETEPPYEENLFIGFYEKKSGNFILSPNRITNRIPYLVPQGRSKSLRGDIAIKLPLPLDVVNDTIRLDIYLLDRALNKSNVITTPETIITTTIQQ